MVRGIPLLHARALPQLRTPCAANSFFCCPRRNLLGLLRRTSLPANHLAVASLFCIRCAALAGVMVDAVDLTLTDSEDEAPPAPTAPRRSTAQDAGEAQQRKRVMEFARNAAVKRQSLAESDPAALPVAEAIQHEAAATTVSAGPSTSKQPAIAGASSCDGLSNADLRALHEARMRRQQAANGVNSEQAAGSLQQQQPTPRQQLVEQLQSQPAARAASLPGSKSISLLTYNVWFKESVAVVERMMALGDIIQQAGLPTFICLQEVTPFILELFVQSAWWKAYWCSPPPEDAPYFTLLLVKKDAAPGISPASFKEALFRNSVMGRGLRSVLVNVAGQPLLVATSHLESPIPPTGFYSTERQRQMAEALATLDSGPADNVLFAGDMNWEDKRDGSPPLPPGWCDAWQKLHPSNPGLTYNTKANPMLPFKGLALRLDRVLCKLRDWKLLSLKMLGTEPLPGVRYIHTFRNGGSKELPVLPSDHFGLLLQLEEF